MDLGGLPKSSESQECSKNDLITLDFLKEHLEYRDGHLWWIKPTARCVKIGQQFGTDHNRGYRQGKLKGKLFLEHRLIWFYHHGVWPVELDHKDTNKKNNDIDNLRELTHKQNMLNQGSRKGTSKHRGIFWSKDHNKWRVKFCVDGKYHHVGMFDDEQMAVEASNEFIKTVEYSRQNETNNL